jgi:hypothetical protein
VAPHRRHGGALITPERGTADQFFKRTFDGRVLTPKWSPDGRMVGF